MSLYKIVAIGKATASSSDFDSKILAARATVKDLIATLETHVTESGFHGILNSGQQVVVQLEPIFKPYFSASGKCQSQHSVDRLCTAIQSELGVFLQDPTDVKRDVVFGILEGLKNVSYRLCKRLSIQEAYDFLPRRVMGIRANGASQDIDLIPYREPKPGLPGEAVDSPSTSVTRYGKRLVRGKIVSITTEKQRVHHFQLDDGRTVTPRNVRFFEPTGEIAQYGNSQFVRVRPAELTQPDGTTVWVANKKMAAFSESDAAGIQLNAYREFRLGQMMSEVKGSQFLRPIAIYRYPGKKHNVSIIYPEARGTVSAIKCTGDVASKRQAVKWIAQSVQGVLDLHARGLVDVFAKRNISTIFGSARAGAGIW